MMTSETSDAPPGTPRSETPDDDGEAVFLKVVRRFLATPPMPRKKPEPDGTTTD